MRHSNRLLPLVLCCALFAACGVRFSSGDEGTEFFKSLTVTGPLKAGATLTGSVFYAQRNPIDVQVSCELRQGKQLVKPIGLQNVPALPGGGPEATPTSGRYTFDFTVDAPGTYKAECFTPADEDNFILRTFTVSQ